MEATTQPRKSVIFLATVDHTDDVACCEGFIGAGEPIIVAYNDGSVWHPECSETAGYVPDWSEWNRIRFGA